MTLPAAALIVSGLTAVTPLLILAQDAPLPVDAHNFARAETDLYMSATVKEGGFAKFRHSREATPIDKQNVVRMNRDTLYSSAVFDLDAAPVTITLPDPRDRFMSMQITSEDHYAIAVVYAPGVYTYTKEEVGTRYVFMAIRTLADPERPEDLKGANALQDAVQVKQARTGSFEVPTWDMASQDKVRDAFAVLGSVRASAAGAMFGRKEEVDPIDHLIGTAIGWGGNPNYAAIYNGVYPKQNDGKTVYALTVRDVPVDGFWSISVYDAKGYFEQNALNAYSLNNLTAKPNPDGAFAIQFGGCRADSPNCLPIMAGWNYTVRMYRPRKEVLDGKWKFPEAKPAQ